VTARAEPVALREMTLADVPAGLRLSAEAGWNQREQDWRFLLERHPGRFVVATRGSRVVGSGGAVCYGTTLAWVCMILVESGERGRGIGTRLVEGVLARVSDVAAVGLDATPQGQGVYAQLGFVETSRLSRLEAPPVLRAGSAPPCRPECGLRVRPLGASDLEDVLALDRNVFGADRADLLRWSSAIAPAFCARDEGAPGVMAGYCFSRRGARSYQVGPIVAHDAATARALLEAAAREAQGAPVVIDVPADGAEWRAALADVGFQEQRPLIRMLLRGGMAPPQARLQLAIFGPEFA
jgi:GNAT superfamily N-acetyltransferase